MQELSWYAKYQPKVVEDYIFETEVLRDQVKGWIEAGSIPGNILLYGKAGLGKSALAEILIRSMIKSPHDLKKMRSRSVAEVDELFSWLQKSPVKSKKKIVLFEEMDRISPQSITQLKSDVMEKFQGLASFIATTNYVTRLDPALVSRFNYRIELKGDNTEGFEKRLKVILETEKVQFDETKLKDFVISNHKIGMRNLITLLQANSVNGSVDFDSIKSESGSSEEHIVDLVVSIFNTIFSTQDSVSRQLAMIQPLNNSVVCKDYAELSEILQYTQNMDYLTIFEMIAEKIKFIPIQALAAKYADTIEYKKMKNLTFLAFIYDAEKSIIDIS